MALEKRQLPEADRKVARFEILVNIIILATLVLVVVNTFVCSFYFFIFFFILTDAVPNCWFH
jgi:hypothetical protein